MKWRWVLQFMDNRWASQTHNVRPARRFWLEETRPYSRRQPAQEFRTAVRRATSFEDIGTAFAAYVNAVLLELEQLDAIVAANDALGVEGPEDAARRRIKAKIAWGEL